MGPAHFSISLVTNFCKYAGERRSGVTRSAPASLSRAATAGVLSAVTDAALSLLTIAVGVRLGKKNASQLSVTKPFNPCSCAVASVGKVGDRSRVNIASAFTVLPSMCGIAAEALRQK